MYYMSKFSQETLGNTLLKVNGKIVFKLREIIQDIAYIKLQILDMIQFVDIAKVMLI